MNATKKRLRYEDKVFDISEIKYMSCVERSKTDFGQSNFRIVFESEEMFTIEGFNREIDVFYEHFIHWFNYGSGEYNLATQDIRECDV